MKKYIYGEMMNIRKGTSRDIDIVSELYDKVNDYLDNHINYPGWKKGIYPTREDAVQGIAEEALFVVVEGELIVETFILRHQPERGYDSVDWRCNLGYEDIFVVYTVAVHPCYRHQGIGRKIMTYIFDYAKRMNMKAVRLDVYEKNIPAIELYESLGFEYIDTVDLGYSMYGLDFFRLYQYII